MNTENKLTSCHSCGLVQYIPIHSVEQRVLCSRCHSSLQYATSSNSHLTKALTLSALIFYLPAMFLPIMQVEKLGHRNEDSLFSGLISLFSQGYYLIGAIVLLFSVIFPLFKLSALFILLQLSEKAEHHHRAMLYHLVEYLGRWSMLDVMLISILVAFIKLGDLVNIQISSGLYAFSLLVLFSLFAGLSFNPHSMWECHEQK